jgi:predicted RNA-binding protein with PIN domain
VLSLLQVPDLMVIVDGYNVSKDVRGVPAAELADQRGWLIRVVAGATARWGAKFRLVFDGRDDRTKATAATRGVRVEFTIEGQTADARIVELVDHIKGPLMVVTSDREVREASEALGANVVASGVFLRAVQ